MSSMQPDNNFITIHDNKKLIEEFIKEMIIEPRQKAHKWSKITNQTPNLKSGYPMQHLASLIVGMEGTATGARGDDIVDKSEVKACSKVDQSDKCKECGENVLRIDTKCFNCGTSNIKRNNDSKWLISIRTEDELRMYLEETPRFIFIVTDYPKFDEGNYADIRIRAFEIWVKSERANNFRELLTNYYKYIYLEHKRQNPKSNPAPKNLFPDNFPFYMCNPIKIFECVIENSLDKNCSINITHYIEPHINRENLPSEKMNKNLLSKDEKDILESNNIHLDEIDVIDENMRKYLNLRDTDKVIKTIGTKKHK